MDKDKTNKKKLLELITKILMDENTTVSDFIKRIEKAFDKLKKEKRSLTDEEIEELLRIAKVVAHSKTPAMFIAGCVDDNDELKELVAFAQGTENDIIPLLGSAVYKVLKDSGIPAKEFFKAIEMLEG